jgi:hypothetical protein
MLYSHLATKYPSTPSFFQCSPKQFKEPCEISMEFYFRRTQRGDSKLTPLYAVARASLRHAVKELKLGEPYVSWEEFEASHSWKERRRSRLPISNSGGWGVFNVSGRGAVLV